MRQAGLHGRHRHEGLGGCGFSAAGPLKQPGQWGCEEGVLFQKRLRWGWVAEAKGDESGPPELPASF